MYVRLNMMAGDPASLGKATRYLEATVRPHVEAQAGSRGLACLTNTDLGLCVVASYWDSAEAMTDSEQAVQISRKEMTGLIRGTVTVEHYEVPVFVRRSRPRAGAGTRLVRIDGDPAHLGAAVDEFRNTSVPALTEMPGLCSVQLLADPATGRCVMITTWEDADAMAASRAAAAALRTTQAAVAHVLIRSVEEYRLAFSSVREGDTRSLIKRNIELWNTRDREDWLATTDLHRLELEAPGGIRLLGRDAADTLWDTWHQAFPGHRLEIIAIHADERGGVHEGRFIGTHTGTLRGPSGAIAATGRTLDGRFSGVYEFDDGKITSLHLYFDQAGLLSQLGLAQGGAAGDM